MKSVVTSLLRSCKRLAQSSALPALAWGYLGFCVLTGVIAQPLLNYYAGSVYQAQTGRALQYDGVSFNPLSLTLSISNARDLNPDGSLFWQVDRIEVNLALLKSLLHLAPGLDAIKVQGLTLAIAEDSAGQFNFSDILAHQARLNGETTPATDATATSASPAPLPRFFIGHTHLDITALHYQQMRNQQTHQLPREDRAIFRQSIEAVVFQLEGFSTLNHKQQPYSLTAKWGERGRLEWRGDLSLTRSLSNGEVRLHQLPLAPLAQYFDGHINTHLASADLSLNARYQLDWHRAPDWRIENLDAALDNVKAQSTTDGDLDLALKQLRIEGATANTAERLISLPAITLDGLRLSSWSDANNLGIVRALTPVAPVAAATTDTATSVDAAAMPVAAITTTPAAQAPAWQLSLGALQLTRSSLQWTLKDYAKDAIALDDIQLDLRNIVLGTPASAAPVYSDLSLSAQLPAGAARGAITAKGSIDVNSLDGELALHTRDLPLAMANPFLSEFIAGDITQGTLNLAAQIALKQGAPSNIQTSGSIDNFLLKPQDAREEAVSFGALRFDNTHVDIENSTVHAGDINLTQLDGRFIITAAGTTNLDALLRSPSPVTATESDTATPKNTPMHSSAAPTEATAPWMITLNQFVLDNASFRFHDQSLTPKFTAAVQNFSGKLARIESNQTAPAPFSFSGNVDGYAPVSLTGVTQPFLAEPLVKANFSFKHLDLGGLSAYSSTYAGWRIDRGQLSADLQYSLADNRIHGDNRVVMDKLQLGERVRSAQAMDIPLRLALAMITDANGRAALDIVVSGDVDAPSFHLGKLIGDALRNSLAQLITSPFRLLGNLAGSDEDLGVLPFNSGSSKILATANRRLHSLQTALEQRPDLRIQLSGRIDPIADQRGLQANYAKAALLNSGISESDIKHKNARWEAAVKKLYRQVPDKQLGELTPDEVYEDWLTTFSIHSGELAQLALTRASVAKTYLVQNLQIDPARVFINASSNCQETDPSQCRRRIAKIDLTDRWDM